jgi:hypothetical protein
MHHQLTFMCSVFGVEHLKLMSSAQDFALCTTIHGEILHLIPTLFPTPPHRSLMRYNQLTSICPNHNCGQRMFSETLLSLLHRNVLPYTNVFCPGLWSTRERMLVLSSFFCLHGLCSSTS